MSGFVGFGKGLWKWKLGNTKLRDLGRRYCLRRQMSWHDDLRRLECPMKCVLRQDFQFVKLQRREDNLFHHSLVLKFGEHLSVIALSEMQLVRRLAIDNRRSPF